MKHLKPYEIFEAKDSNYLIKYDQNQLEKSLGEKPSPGMLGWLNNIFSKMETRFDNYESDYNSGRFGTTAISKTSGGTPADFGFGFLVGAAGSLASDIGKKLTEPSKPSTLSDKDLEKKRNLVHQSLFDDKGIPNGLDKIKNEKSLMDRMEEVYKSNGIKAGEDPSIDNMMVNYAGTWAKQSGAVDLAAAAEEGGAGAEVLSALVI